MLSGDAWTRCDLGHRHWGRYGAAGLLISAGDTVLLQQRAEWTHRGGTWAVPGGARNKGETAQDAALREAVEEVAVDPRQLELGDTFTDDHGGWSYVTVVAVPRVAREQLAVRALAETAAVAWVAVDRVVSYDLHPGFAASWPSVRLLAGAL